MQKAESYFGRHASLQALLSRGPLPALAHSASLPWSQDGGAKPARTQNHDWDQGKRGQGRPGPKPRSGPEPGSGPGSGTGSKLGPEPGPGPGSRPHDQGQAWGEARPGARRRTMAEARPRIWPEWGRASAGPRLTPGPEPQGPGTGSRATLTEP